NLPLEKDFDIYVKAKYELTGGQIELVIRNTAYKIAVNDNPIFILEDFKEQRTKEQKGQYDSETKVGFF
ncbi:AAA family ATPase, partial [Aliarcobacter butzleri]